jgi:hypothetical protein
MTEQTAVNRILIRLVAICLVLSSICFVSDTNQVRAQETESNPSVDPELFAKAFQFYPSEAGFGSYFDPTIEAGKSGEFTVLLANIGTQNQDLRTYAINAFTDAGGGFTAAEYGAPANDVTSWLDYDVETYSVEPGKGIERAFTISVPAGTAPGQYLTAVAAEQADTSAVEGSENFTQRVRFVIPVFITVPGPTTSGFTIGDVTLTIDGEQLAIRIGLENTGDVRVRPEGSVELLDSTGAIAATFPVKMESIYAHESTVLTLGSSAALGSGPFEVVIKLTDPDTGQQAATTQSNLVAASSQPENAPTITIESAVASPKPDENAVQFVSIDAVISNFGEQGAGAQLSLLVQRNGVDIERFPIGQSLSLAIGTTSINSRYIPIDGWAAGTWTFELVLEVVEPSGASIVIDREPIANAIVIQ